MNILFTRELAKHLARTPQVTANSVHPGAVRTNLGAPPAIVRPILRAVLLSAEQGAATTLAAATDPLFADITGSYFVKGKPADDKLSKAAPRRPGRGAAVEAVGRTHRPRGLSEASSGIDAIFASVRMSQSMR